MRGIKWIAAAVVAGMLCIGTASAQYSAPTGRIMPVRRPPEPDPEARAVQMVSVLEQEAAGLGKEGKQKAAAELSTKVARWQDMLAGRELAPRAEPELHLIGVYEGLFPNGPKKFGTAKVQVEIKDRPVVLAMCAYESVRWELKLAEGVKIQRIILMGYYEQEVVGAPAGVAVERHDRAGGGQATYAYKEGEEYKQAEAALRTLTGLPVSTFTGSYQAPETPIVLGPGNKDWRSRRVLAEAEEEYAQATALDRAQQREKIKSLKYEALLWQVQPRPGAPAASRLVSATASLARFEGADLLKGSIRALPGLQALAVDPAGPSYYGASGELMRVDLERKTQAAIPVEGDWPKMSRPGGITFDTKRRRVLIATGTGLGLLYSYEPDKNLWSVLREMNGVGLNSMSYSVEEDCIYGIAAPPTADYATVIHRRSADGVWQEQKPVPKWLPVSRPMPGGPAPQVVSLGANLAVLWLDGEEMHMMVIEWKNNTVLYDGPVKMREEIADAELQQIWDQLGTAPEAQATELVKRMGSGGRRAVELIQKLPPVEAGLAKEQEVTDLSKVESPELRREIRAMRVLGEVGSVEAARALREFATQGGMGVRARAAREALWAM